MAAENAKTGALHAPQIESLTVGNFGSAKTRPSPSHINIHIRLQE
jgi:hypothetical protein